MNSLLQTTAVRVYTRLVSSVSHSAVSRENLTQPFLGNRCSPRDAVCRTVTRHNTVVALEGAGSRGVKIVNPDEARLHGSRRYGRYILYGVFTMLWTLTINSVCLFLVQ